MISKKNGFVEQRTSHENLDTKVSIIRSRSWLIWLVIMFIFICVIAWFIFGFVRVREQGKGIILPRQARIYEADAQGSGIIKEINFKIGDKVLKGHPLATIKFLDTENKIQETEIYLKALKQQKVEIERYLANQNKDLKKYSKKYTDAYNTKLTNAREYKEFMDKYVVSVAGLQKIGAMSLIESQMTHNELFELEGRIVDSIADMANFQFQIRTTKYSWNKEILQIDLKLIETENKLNLYKRHIEEKQYINSPLSGTITQIYKAKDSYISEGEIFATIVMDNEDVMVLAFFPVAQGKRIKTDMTAYVSPSIAKKELYGTIKGTVESILEYPISQKDIAAFLQDQELAKAFCKDGSPLMGKISLERDDTTFSSFKWTSKKGPDFSITTGTLCDIDVVITKRKPITFIIPSIKKFLNLNMGY